MAHHSPRLAAIAYLAISLVLAVVAGCGSKEPKPPAAPGKLAQIAKANGTQAAPAPSTSSQPVAPRTKVQPAPKAPATRSEKSFVDFAQEAEKSDFESAPLIMPTDETPLPVIDEQRVAAAGIRKMSGKHLTLYTDLPTAPAVDELPRVFAAAVPIWSKYFEIESQQTVSWRMVGYLMQDKQRFRQAGLLPADLPPFLHGFQRGSELWWYEQPSDYYRRHLLLHEGTHGFMRRFLGGAGPPWYMEGMAELLATHKWEQNELTLRWFPRDKEQTSHWGRIEVIKEDVQAGRGKSLESIFGYDAAAHLRVEPYAWSWAAAAFFDTHPDYRDRFREMRKFAPDTTVTFSQRFYDMLKDDWPWVTRQWQVFVVNMEYGFDIQREAIAMREVKPLPAEGATVQIAADHGWQSTGWRLEGGSTYRIEASGRYQIGNQPKPWWCEPNGVTIRYYHRRPLGMLVGAIVDEDAPITGTTNLVKPDPIGLHFESLVEDSGTLFLRINDSPAELADNAGTLEVKITRVP